MKTITASLYIAAKPEPIYDALTKAPGVAALLFGSRLETTFEPGAPYAYVGPDGKGGEAVHVEGEVLACEPGKRLVLRHRTGPLWRDAGKVFSSRLTYALEDQGFATRVTVTHDEIEDDDPGYAHNQDGWVIFISRLKTYVETGTPFDVPMG